MPQIIVGPGALDKIDGSVKAKVTTFLSKLGKDDTTSGLHVEPMADAADRRARTARVDQGYRAVLYKLQGSGDEASYVFAGVFDHDTAIHIARTKGININPRNGIAELIPIVGNTLADGVGTTAPPSVETPARPARPAPSTDSADSEAAPDASEQASQPAATPPAGTVLSLRQREFVVEDLTDLGIDARFAEGALDITDEDAALEYAAKAPATWQQNALLDIFADGSLSDVRDKYLRGAPEPAGPSEDDKLLAAMRHPAAQMEFAFIENDEELRAAIENPDFAAWRIFLHPEQRAYVTKRYNGAARVSGGAGTGKTVVLIHRARHLQRRNPSARIVLTTYNRTLAENLKDQLLLLDPRVILADTPGDEGIYVGGIDSIAYQVLTGAGSPDGKPALEGSADRPGPVEEVLGPRTAQILTPTDSNGWKNALAAAAVTGEELPEDLRTKSFLEAEYTAVVLPNLVTDERGYLKVRRAGRGVALSRRRRKAVWHVIAAYRAEAAAAGTTDYDEKPAIAARVLANAGPVADHVLVDEAQDLSPARFQLLRALVAPGPDDLFIAEDMHQRIYGQKIVLSHYGINIRGRSRRLTLNYRTTEENLQFALGILAGAEYTDLDDEPESTAEYRSARSGPTPRLCPVESVADQYALVADTVQGWIDGGVEPASIGLLAPTKQACESLTRALGEHEVAVRYIKRDAPANPTTPLVMTMHRAKGMEFTNAILVSTGEKQMPRKYVLRNLPEADREDALQRERSLLYVAATRARDELVVVWAGERSDLMPAEVGVPSQH